MYNQAPQKQWIEITNVYPPKKEIHGLMRDGTETAVTVFEIPPSFRWPQEGEIWSVEKDPLGSLQWVLGSRVNVNSIYDVSGVETVEKAVTDLDPGDLRLDSDVIYDRRGRQLVTQPALSSLQSTVAAVPTPEPWHYVDGTNSLGTTFLNGWVNYDTTRVARFYKHHGRCYLEGVICNGTIGVYAFVLPPQYRPPLPSNDHYYPVVANGAFGSVIIDSAGGVVPASGGVATWTFLDSIDFRCVG